MTRQELENLLGTLEGIDSSKIKSVLQEAFGTKNTEQLRGHLKKTDMNSPHELLWAVQVIWTNPGCYKVKNRRALQVGLEMIPPQARSDMARAAK